MELKRADEGEKGFEKVFAFLRDRLHAGSLKPGDRLISERDLAIQLGVSRPLVREALRALTMLGIVEIRDRIGTVVTRPDVSVLNDFFTFALAQQADMPDDVMQARVAIECQAIRLACERADIADFERLQTALTRIAETIDKADAGGIADFEFHRTIVLASHSETLAVLHNSMAGLLTHVHRNRRELVQALKSKHPDILVVLDGVHGIGAVDEVLATIGADYISAGTHKWIFAPRGTGIAWSSAEGWARLRPIIPTFSEWESYTAWTEDRPPNGPNNAARMTPGGFHAFEHQWSMTAAFGMHQAMGRGRVAARIHELNTRLKTQLAGHPKIRVHTPASPDLSAGLVAFEIDGMKPEDIVKRLGEQKIVASTSPYAVPYARLAPALVNTPEQVDRAARAVIALAR